MKKDKNELALLRFSIIAPLVNGTCEETSLAEYVRKASEKTYLVKGEPRTFSASVIRKWYYSYRKNGYEGLVDTQRNDYQKPRILSEDAKAEISKKTEAYPKMPATEIYRDLVREGIIEDRDVSLKTVQRYVKMLKKGRKYDPNERRKFQMPAPNDMWQTDTSTGPYIMLEGKKYRTYLIMFLDDHSRLITGYGFYLQDNSLNMQNTLKEAIKVYGVPKILYMDNGGPYVSQQLKIICARLGIIHKNTRAYDPESKGKIERCFRTIKMQWMNGTDWNRFKSLEDVTESFREYVREYNNTIHSATGKTPNDAFHSHEDIRYIPNDDIDRMFWHEVKRTADATSVISVETRKYEVPRECIGRECVFTFKPDDLSVVYYDGQPCKRVDPVANSKKKRKTNLSFVGIVNQEDDVIDLNEKEAANEIS